MTHWPKHARIDGPIVMIGFGSIGKGTLPLIERHFEFDRTASSSSIRMIPIASFSTIAASASSMTALPATIIATC